MKKNDSLSSFCKALKKHKRFLLASHMSPEGDAVGSVLALESLLRRLGKTTLVVCEDRFPERLSCLPHERWNQVDQIPKHHHKFDALVVADCPTLERIGRVQELISKDTEIFNIDHHVSNTFFGTYNYVHPKAAASGEVVYEIFKQFKMKISKTEATELYVAISTDTGSFKYSNTTVNAHLVAAKLIGTGINIEKVNDDIYATYSFERIQLYSLLLGKVEATEDETIAWVKLTRNDLERTGSTYDDTEGFIDFIKYLKEVRFAFFLSEMPNHEVKVSFRSKGDYDVSKVAVYFGGGGHRKAAGCTVKGSLDAATQMVLERVKYEFEKQAQENGRKKGLNAW